MRAGKRGRFRKKKSAQKIQKRGEFFFFFFFFCELSLRGKEGNKKNLQHLHTQRAVFLAHAFIPRERTHGRRERNKKKSERRAPTLFLPLSLARLRWTSVQSVRRSVVGRRPVNFSFFLSRFTKNTTPFSKKRGLKFWKRCRALRAIYDAHRFVDAEKNETNETNARRAFV